MSAIPTWFWFTSSLRKHATCGTYLAFTISNAKARLCRNLMVNIGSSWCPATSALSPAVTTRSSPRVQAEAPCVHAGEGSISRRKRWPRNSVSLVASTLQKSNFIRYSLGRIDITDLDGLRATACEWSTFVKAHERLLRVRSPAQYNYGSVPNANAVRNRINALFKER